MAEKAAKLKEQGTVAFQKQDYDSAVKFYGEAITINSADHVLYSNRSAAYAAAKKYEEALVDACKCVELKPDFAKGYSRKALAQYHLNKLMEAKKSYQEGLKHDSENQVLKTGLKDTEKHFRRWFLSVLAEAADAQTVVQLSICEATHKLVADGCTNLSFLEAHQKILDLGLPMDTLDKYGVSEADCQQTIADYDRVYDYDVVTAAQRMMMPTGKGDPERAGKIEMATVIDAHKWMVTAMKSIVEEFNQLPSETKHSIPKKERERSAELLVSVALESGFKIQSEDFELATATHMMSLEGDAAFLECQTEIGSLMQSLMEHPFTETVSPSTVDSTLKSEDGTAKVSVSASPLGSPHIGSLACNVGVASTLGLVVVLGLLRWRANNK